MTVYFILCSTQRMVKIGHTNNMVKRLHQLQVGCPYELKVIKTMDGDYELEQELHKRFDHYRVQGEWFVYSQEIKDYLNNPEVDPKTEEEIFCDKCGITLKQLEELKKQGFDFRKINLILERKRGNRC